MISDRLLSEFSDQLDELIESSVSVAILLVSPNGDIIDCNSGFRALLELSPADRMGSIDGYLPKDSAERIKTMDEESFDTSFAFSFRDQVAVPLKCRVCRKGEEILIIGQRPFLFQNDSMDTLSQISMEMANLSRELGRKNRELKLAQEEIKTLTGLITICSYCKNIKNDAGSWEQLETYVSTHSDTEFSHGVCDDCFKKVSPEGYAKQQKRKEQGLSD